MNENSKTGIFAGALVLTLLAWFITYPRSFDSGKGKKSAAERNALFGSYDPLEATVMKIIKYDEELGQVSDFEIAKDSTGLWTIPSHGGYPADAAAQMSEAASLFISLNPLAEVTDVAKEHTTYGVMEPDVEKLQVGDKGVGTLVRIQNAKNENIVSLIIGGTEKDKPTHRFVRKPGQDMVYLVDLKTDALSTDFARWIEGDLLKLSSTDIQNIGIRDYAIVPTSDGAQALSPNFDADVSFSTVDNKWTPDSIRVHEGANTSDRVLAENEQLNATKLNDMRNALDSLRIVDVRKKPAGLAADLKVEKAFLDDKESIIAMARRGFIPQKGADGSSEIYASNGELLASLTNGVQYLIRFGNTTGESSDAKKEAEEGEKKDDSLKLDRYMLVTVRVDESKFPPVSLKQLPETYDDLLRAEAAEKALTNPAAQPKLDGLPIEIPAPAGNDQANPPAANENPSLPAIEPAKNEPAGDQPGEPAKVESTDPPAAKDGEKKDGGESTSAVAPTAKQFVKFQPPAEGAPAAEPTAPAAAEAPVAQPPAAATPAPAAGSEPPAELTEEEKKEKLELAREKITKENQRMIDDRNEKLTTARKKVAELNARFSEWFYVIGESEYKRLRVKLDELIQPKSAAGASMPGGPGGAPGFNPGFNPGAFPRQ